MIAWWGFVGRIFIEDLSTMWNSCSLFPHSLSRKVWQVALVACTWTLWLERNNVLFSGNRMNVDEMFALVKYRSLEWNIADDSISPEKAK